MVKVKKKRDKFQAILLREKTREKQKTTEKISNDLIFKK